MTNRSDLPPVSVGAVLDLSDADYRYGVGRLRLRVTSVPERQQTFGGEWMCLHGVEIDWRNADVGPRRVYVCVAALRRLLPTTGGRSS